MSGNPDHKGQLLANVWVKTIPRTDTKDGQQAYEEHLKQLKKKAKDNYKSFSYQLVKMEFKCSSRTYHVGERYDYEGAGNIIYKWPTNTNLEEILHQESVTPDSTSECLLEIACKVAAEKPN